MSTSRETVIFIVLANLVLTALVVAGAIAIFVAPEQAKTPGDQAHLEEALRLADLELARLREDTDALKLAAEDRLLSLEQKIRSLQEAPDPEVKPLAETPAAAGATSETTAEEQLMKGLGEMLRQQARQGRDRFIKELMNPTAQSQERTERRLRGLVSRATRNLELDAAAQQAVEQIVLDVDYRRRENLRTIFASKESPDDVTYGEVKEVLDDSFQEEDDLISQALSPEQAEQYRENAEPIRQFILVATQTAFPAGNDD